MSVNWVYVIGFVLTPAANLGLSPVGVEALYHLTLRTLNSAQVYPPGHYTVKLQRDEHEHEHEHEGKIPSPKPQGHVARTTECLLILPRLESGGSV
jgi:hypothetical protein